ncbi:MAG: DUF4438 domain-containing protein, partial [Candidatus Bathyarchaeota archaeon]|nr:DUF4438 domain-containing protein [Candidatus Bathyarchaeota archaeon]
KKKNIQVMANFCIKKLEDRNFFKPLEKKPIMLENLRSIFYKMELSEKGGQLIVPVTKEVPGFLMGSGIGSDPCVETNDYDIQTTCPEYVAKYGLQEIRLGDIVAIKDHYCAYGRGRYEGAMTIGVVIHGWSDSSGHGPGINPVLSALPGRMRIKKDLHANIAFYLGLRKKPEILI